ncbi:MAG: rRNA maturation RNase YbeY [Nitrospirae bacterium]|nr:rRNA maturation RNase YbeY [Nitrospirota bacterium]
MALTLLSSKRAGHPLLRAELSIVLVDNDKMHALNKQYRGVDKTTDVLSFPMYNTMREFPKEGDFLLGDVIINTECIYSQLDPRQSTEAKTAEAQKQLRILLVHALLHLVGFDHEIDGQHDRLMKKKEAELLNALKKMD